MTDFTHSEARIFRHMVNHHVESKARRVRAQIRTSMLKGDPALREAVDEDVQALCRQAVQERGCADMSDLTRAGYSQDVALHFAERLAAAHRAASLKAAPRFGQTTEGNAA